MPIVKINPTGTHIQHGFLKVRVDIYPSPSDKTYPIHYVDKPDRPYTEEELENEELQALVPKHKELNPCLCHFIKIDPEATFGELVAEIRRAIDPSTFRQIDNILFEEDGLEKEIRVTPDPRNLIAELNNRRQDLVLLMKPKSGRGRILPYATDAKKLKRAIDKRFAGLEVEV